MKRIHWILLALAAVSAFLGCNDESAHFDDVESQLARERY